MEKEPHVQNSSENRQNAQNGQTLKCLKSFNFWAWTDQTTRQDWICYDFYFTAILWARKFKKLCPLARTSSLSPWLQSLGFLCFFLVWKIIPAFLTMVFVVINFRLAMRTAAFSAAAALDPLSYSLPPGMLGMKSKKRTFLRFFMRPHPTTMNSHDLKQLGASPNRKGI